MAVEKAGWRTETVLVECMDMETVAKGMYIRGRVASAGKSLN